jgi:hypothetical protein
MIEQDVQVPQHVGVEQMRLVEEEDRMEPVLSQLVDVSLDGEEEVGRGGGGLQTEGVAEIAVEVTPPESGISTIGQAKARLGEAMAKRTKDTGLSHPGLAQEQDAVPLGEGVLDLGHERGLALGEPELGVVDLLGKRGGAKTEALELRRPSHRPPPRARW